MGRFLLSLLVICTTLASAQDQWKDIYRESAWTERDQWQKPDELLRFLSLKNGSQVADIGCHEGYMSIKLAKIVGDKGKVYAIDVEQGKLDRLAINLDKRKIVNVVAIKGDYDDPKLPKEQLDGVLIIDTYHEMRDHQEILRHVLESLRIGGRLLLCEPIADERRKMPRSDQERKHELGMSFAFEDLQKAGFSIVRKQDPFIDRTKEKGDKMWIIVAVKK